MEQFIGIDLGTSSVKALLLGENGEKKSAVRSYHVHYPKPGFSEQNPADWFSYTLEALRELLKGTDRSSIRAISFSGQMHGLVALDAGGNVLRPAILWNDGRSVSETRFLNETFGREKLLKHTGNIAFPGFTLPKLLWMKEHEPDLFKKIDKVLLPKDYLAFCLTGNFCTDVSDAGGTLYFDVKNRRWSPEMLHLAGISKEQLPHVLESNECAGILKPSLQKELGLGEVRVIIGAGDNAAAAFGAGAVKNGGCNLSLGTSGTIYVASDTFCCDTENAIHAFPAANGKYHLLACILSAAASVNWWNDVSNCKSFLNFENLPCPLGTNDVLFLPYLIGERSPCNDAKVRSLFCSLGLDTTHEQMSLAVLEGVAFALRQNFELIRAHGIPVSTSSVCGGGTNSDLWLQILADVLHLTLTIPKNPDCASLGAALLAARGVLPESIFSALYTAETQSIKTVSPIPDESKRYDEQYRRFLKLYPAAKTFAGE